MLHTPPGVSPQALLRRGEPSSQRRKGTLTATRSSQSKAPSPGPLCPASLVLRGLLPAWVRLPPCPKEIRSRVSPPPQVFCPLLQTVRLCFRCCPRMPPDRLLPPSPPGSLANTSGPFRHTSASPAACFLPFLLQDGPPGSDSLCPWPGLFIVLTPFLCTRSGPGNLCLSGETSHLQAPTLPHAPMAPGR